MLVYPQLATGALSQFPLRKTRRTRTVANRAADGSSIRLADPAAEVTEWQLRYSDLSDQEAAALRGFFETAEGSLNGFTFLDPAGNLLAWSEQLDAQVWQRDPMLTVTPQAGFWRLSNAGAAAQTLAQTLAAPGVYQYCLSAYMRSNSAADIGLIVAGRTAQQALTPNWGRVVLVGSGDEDDESMRFGIEVPAGATVDVYGIQVEAQGGASVCKTTTRGGVYLDAHLGEDELSLTSTAMNRHSCTVKIIHANHL